MASAHFSMVSNGITSRHSLPEICERVQVISMIAIMDATLRGPRGLTLSGRRVGFCATRKSNEGARDWLASPLRLYLLCDPRLARSYHHQCGASGLPWGTRK